MDTMNMNDEVVMANEVSNVVEHSSSHVAAIGIGAAVVVGVVVGGVVAYKKIKAHRAKKIEAGSEKPDVEKTEDQDNEDK